jgi:hypothetical protein
MGLDIAFYDAEGKRVVGYKCRWFWDYCPDNISHWIFDKWQLMAADVARLHSELVEYRNLFEYRTPVLPENALKIVEAISKEDADECRKSWDAKNYFRLDAQINEIYSLLENTLDDCSYPSIIGWETVADAKEEWYKFREDWENRGWYHKKEDWCMTGDMPHLDYIIDYMGTAALENWYAEWSY